MPSNLERCQRIAPFYDLLVPKLAAELGRSGTARASRLPPEERPEIARKAAIKWFCRRMEIDLPEAHTIPPHHAPGRPNGIEAKPYGSHLQPSERTRSRSSNQR